MFRTSVFAPRLGTSLPTGATALEAQQDVNHHSRYDVSQRKRRNVPQEVSHGDNLTGGVLHAEHTTQHPSPHDKAAPLSTS